MTALVDRGANLLVTVSPVARCYIFIYIFYIIYLLLPSFISIHSYQESLNGSSEENSQA